MKNRKKIISISCCVLAAVFIATAGKAGWTQVMLREQPDRIIVIDAGHGGDDSGKIGINQALEKDINLSIAKFLKTDLEQNDYTVVMTRENEGGLYDEGAQNKKVQDLQRRIEIIEKSNAVIAVSIHQNSYHEEDCKGAQVFYHEESKEGKKLAEQIQAQLVQAIDLNNHRVAKANKSYFLLKKTQVPTVIVECGFLSNWDDANELSSEEYQKKMAFQISMAIQKYLNGI